MASHRQSMYVYIGDQLIGAIDDDQVMIQVSNAMRRSIPVRTITGEDIAKIGLSLDGFNKYFRGKFNLAYEKICKQITRSCEDHSKRIDSKYKLQTIKP